MNVLLRTLILPIFLVYLLTQPELASAQTALKAVDSARRGPVDSLRPARAGGMADPPRGSAGPASVHADSSMPAPGDVRAELAKPAPGNGRADSTRAKAVYPPTLKTHQLKEVSVVATRPFIERQADKIIVNVESSVMSTGSTALEVLQRTPGITLDKDDHLQLKGKAGVTVMLDGKLTYLSADQISNLLKNMGSENISRIEVITNPSAKYDAQGNTGIINIVTRKGRKAGLNGTLTAVGSRASFYNFNTGFSLDYKTSKFNFFADFNHSERRNIFKRYNYSVFSLSPLAADDLNSRDLNKGQHNQYKAGVDYNLDKDNTLSFTVNGYRGLFQKDGHGTTSDINRNAGHADTLFQNHNQIHNPYSNLTYALDYKVTLDSLGRELSGGATYAVFHDHSEISEENTPVNDTTGINNGVAVLQLSHQPSQITIKTLKADYTHPVDSNIKIEGGAKASWVKTSNNFSYDSLADGIAARTTRLNDFQYTERILAAYLSTSLKFNKFSIQAGLRLENTQSIGDLVNTGSVTSRDYTDFFPNLSLTQKFNDVHQLAFSVTRRINRPDYDNLNPFVFYLDKKSYFIGNPDLKPQYTLSYELSYSFKQKYIGTVSYADTRNYINEFASIDPLTQSTRYTIINFASQHSFNATLSAPADFTPWWTSTNNFSLNYNTYLNQLIADGSSKSIAAYNLNIIETFKLPGAVKIELNAFYNSKDYDGTYHIQAQYALGGGIQKTFLKKKADLKLNMTDIFNTQHFYGNARYNNVDINIRNKWESRRLTLAFTYRFGGVSNAEVKKKNNGQDESSRVGGKG